MQGCPFWRPLKSLREAPNWGFPNSPSALVIDRGTPASRSSPVPGAWAVPDKGCGTLCRGSHWPTKDDPHTRASSFENLGALLQLSPHRAGLKKSLRGSGARDGQEEVARVWSGGNFPLRRSPPPLLQQATGGSDGQPWNEDGHGTDIQTEPSRA